MQNNTFYKVNSSDVVFEKGENEVVLLNLKKGIYYSINKEASIIWQMLVDQISFQEILNITNNENLKAKIKEFIDFLSSEELILETTSENTNKPDNIKIDSAPEYTKYSDLEDLLLLDPIHEVDEAGWPNKK